MKHWYTMIEVPDADTRAPKGDPMARQLEMFEQKRPTSEKIMLTALLLAVAVTAFCVARSFAGSIQKHVFCAGVTFDAVGVSTQAVVVSTETGRGEQ